MNHRKLIEELDSSNLTSFCAPFCDPSKNIYGLCDVLCYNNCPSCCFNTPPPDVDTRIVRHKSQNLHQFLIISLSVVGLVCLLYCLFMVYRNFKNKRRRSFQEEEILDHDRFVDEEHGPVLDHPIWYIRTVGLPASTIESITVVKYKKDEGLIEGTDCAVCLSEFEDDESLRLLPKCNHAFHIPCIDTWLGSHTNCPMCRAPIVSNPNRPLASVPETGPEEDTRVAVSEERESEERESEERDEVQPMRRSISMNSLANPRLGEINENIVAKRPDFNGGLMRFFMKRSFSCSGKVLCSRFNRDINSVLPP